MDGKCSGRKDRTTEIVKSMKGQQFEPKAPIATEMFLPNVSNVQDFARKDRPNSSGLTTGSVLFADAQGQVYQDNANLFWDDSNNRLGIGTASPSATLGVIQNTFPLAVFDRSGSGIGSATIQLIGQSGKTSNLIGTDDLELRAPSGEYLRLSIDSSTKLIIKDDGKVGIGTATPGEALDVNGKIQMSSGTAIIHTATSDGADNTFLKLAGGGSESVVRGAVIVLSGNEDSTFAGDLVLNPGNIAGAFVTIDSETLNVGGGKVGIGTILPIADLHVSGGFATAIVAKTGAYTTTANDHVITCGAGNESFTVTLIAASGLAGLMYHIKNVGTGTITVDGNSAETIDGSATAVISTQFASIKIICDGSNWHII